MIRLLLVEINRFCSRRAIVLLILAGALLGVGLAGKIIWDTRPPTQDELSTAAAQARLATDAPEMQTTIKDCEKDPTVYLPPGSTASDCSTLLAPTPQSMLERDSLHLRDVLDGHGTEFAVLLIGLLVIAGATYAGADWGSDSMSNQVVFAPNRLKVWLAKGLAATLVALVASTVILGGFWLAMMMTVDQRNITVSDHVTAQIGWHVVRAIGLAGGATLGAYALTMIFRHTVATLGVLFAYAVGGEILISLLPVEGVARWAVGNNIFGWLKPDFRYFDQSVGCKAYQACDATKALSHLDAGWFLGALLLVTLVVSAATFVRRDV